MDSNTKIEIPREVNIDADADLEAFRIACAGLSEGQRAMKAARFVHSLQAPGQTLKLEKRAAQAASVGIATVRRARTVLRLGTPEQIADVESGKLAVTPLGRAISHKNTPAKSTVNVAERNSQNGAIWTNLRTALDCIGRLPRPEDTARITVGQARRMKFPLDEKTLIAVEWLTKFMGEI